jgi:hypothetical protein
VAESEGRPIRFWGFDPFGLCAPPLVGGAFQLVFRR